MHFFERSFLLLSLVASTTLASAQCTDQPVSFDVPEQSLQEAIHNVSRTSGCPVVAHSSVTQGMKTKGIKGRMTTSAALIALVKGTGLEVNEIDGKWVVDQTQQQYFKKRLSATRLALVNAMQQGIIPAKESDAYANELHKIEKGVPQYIRKQGFLSAAERSSYTALLDRMDQKFSAKASEQTKRMD